MALLRLTQDFSNKKSLITINSLSYIFFNGGDIDKFLSKTDLYLFDTRATKVISAKTFPRIVIDYPIGTYDFQSTRYESAVLCDNIDILNKTAVSARVLFKNKGLDVIRIHLFHFLCPMAQRTISKTNSLAPGWIELFYAGKFHGLGDVPIIENTPQFIFEIYRRFYDPVQESAVYAKV